MTVNVPAHKILLIENNSAVVDQVRAALSDGAGPFDLDCAGKLSKGIERLHKDVFVAILLGLSLPDSQGVETFDQLLKAMIPASPPVPILIVGGMAGDGLAQQAVGRGARDHLPLDHLDSYSLPRALRNAIERTAVEDALYAEKERAVVTLNSIGDAVLCTDVSGKITYLNLVAESLTGWQRQEAIGKPLAEVFRIIDGATREPARDPLEMATSQNRAVGLTVDCVLIRRDAFEFSIQDSAAPIHDRSGRVIGAVIVFHDSTAAQSMSVQMTHSAQHDLVTNLPNRLLLNDRITQSIALARRQTRPIAILFLDLDDFKQVNDTLGHAAGDKLLQSVSKRLVAALRGSDTVSRQGGDEFVVLLPEISYAADAGTSAKKILFALSAPHSIAGHDQQMHDLHINSSIGISIYPNDGADGETLVKNADTAMYHAKEKGGNSFQFFTAEMNLKTFERQSFERGLKRALDQGEFFLDYQPKVNLDTGEITGMEALIRWRLPDGGIVPPSDFVPVAENCGLIINIGRWAMREACRQAHAWQDAGLPALPIAVNVSAVEFRDKGFAEGVRRILAETGLAARYLEIELTESVIMENVDATTAVLQELKRVGVQLAVDDFGTGYSSLSYLRHFPIDVLKIDQSFVQQITADPGDSAIAAAIINMGKSLKLLVVAEGIETREQKEYLQTLMCAQGQGYLFSPPVAAAPFARLLRTGKAGLFLQ